MKDLWKLSRKNYHNHKKIYRVLSFSIGMSLFMILLFLALSKGCNQMIKQSFESMPDAQKVIIYQYDQKTADESLADKEKPMIKYEDISKIYKNVNPHGLSVDYYLEDPETYKVKVADILLEDGVENIRGVDASYDTFCGETNHQEKDQIKIVAGRDLKSNNENSALIESGVAYGAGCDNPEEMIGKTIEFSKASETLQVKIVGVYEMPELRRWGDGEQEYIYTEEEYKENCQELEMSDLDDSDIVLSLHAIQELNKNKSMDEFYSVEIAQNDTSKIINTYNWIEKRYGNEIDCDIKSMNDTMDYMQTFAMAFVVAGIVLMIIAMTNMISVIMLTSESRKKWFAIQKIIGFSNKQLSFGYVLELVCALFRPLVASIGAIYILGFLFSKIITSTMEEELSGNIWFLPPLQSVFGVVCAVLLFVVIIYWIAMKRMQKIDIVDTLKSI